MSIDGLRPANTHKAEPITVPKQPAKLPAQARRVRAHKPQTARAMHTKQTTPVKRARQPKQHTVHVKMPIESINYSEHKLPRSAHLTEARSQRSRYYRQHSQVSRYGNKVYAPIFSAPEEQPTQPQRQAVDIPGARIAEHQRNISQRIAEHHIRSAGHQVVVAGQQENNSKKRKRAVFFGNPRTVNIAASMASLVLILGYVAYINAPNLALRVAASRAGIDAHMPKYQPSGFALNGPVQYSEGEVTLAYKARSDERTFTLTQEESGWDSQSLLENYVLDNSSRYETVEEDGLTIYIFNGSEAAWVNKGVLYSIEGDSLLDHQQIVSIATSL